MDNKIVILGAVLAAQLLLALGLNLAGDDHGAFQPREKLLAFDSAKIDGLRIEDGEQAVTLRKQNGDWLLPERDGYPVGDGRAGALLNRLAALEKGWPVATSAGAAERFKLTATDFERRITLLSGQDAVAVLYIGSSPGFRKVHLRPDGDASVYAAEFSTWEAGAKAADWVDKSVLELPVEDIAAVRMPDFELRRDGETLKLAGLLEGDTVKQEEIDRFVRQLAGLRIQSVLGKAAKPEYAQQQPVLELTLTHKEKGELHYRFSKPAEGEAYVLKRSDQDYHFELSGFSVDAIKDMARSKLVEAKPEPESVSESVSEPESEPEPEPKVSTEEQPSAT
jgi:hypothetical protein